MARSNYSPEQLLATIPTNYEEIACASWFSDVARWAEIERVEDIKEQAWLAIKQIERTCKRICFLNILKGKLEAYIKIFSIETPEKEITIDEVTKDIGIDIDKGFDTELDDASYPWPSFANNDVAGDPELPDMPS